MMGARIKAARKAAGFSLRDLAGRVDVSAQAISKYERDLVTPSEDTLFQLSQALNVRTEFFFRPTQVTLSRPPYRKRTNLGRKEEEAIVGQIQEWLERYLEVEQLFPSVEEHRFALPEELCTPVSSIEDIETVALQLRKTWGLGVAPIEDLTAVLEDKGIKIGLIDGPEQFDACTFETDDGIPVIVTKPRLPGDRQRMNLAHELGHFVLNTDEEKAAFRFAGAFLVPAEMARFELGSQRQRLDVQELDILKHKYGLSMQAWIYRAKDLGILSESAAVELFREFRSVGWHYQEPGNQLPSEEPKRMQQLVRRALAEDLISRSRAAELLGQPIKLTFRAEDQRPREPSVLPLAEEERKHAGYTVTLRH